MALKGLQPKPPASRTVVEPDPGWYAAKLMALPALSLLDSCTGQSASIGISAAEATDLAKLALLLDRWNRVHSLTTITEPEAVVYQHIWDSWQLVPLLRSWLAQGPSASTLWDIGSGNGFPGLVLAVACPGLTIHLVERVARKAAFLRMAIGQLGLRGRVQVLEQDVRDISAARPADWVVSRAYAALPAFLDTTKHLAGPDTHWVYWAGRGDVLPTDFPWSAAEAGQPCQYRCAGHAEPYRVQALRQNTPNPYSDDRALICLTPASSQADFQPKSPA